MADSNTLHKENVGIKASIQRLSAEIKGTFRELQAEKDPAAKQALQSKLANLENEMNAQLALMKTKVRELDKMLWTSTGWKKTKGSTF